MYFSLYSSTYVLSAFVLVKLMNLNFSMIMCDRHRLNHFCSFHENKHFSYKENLILRYSWIENHNEMKIECEYDVCIDCCRIYHDVIFVRFEFFVEKKKIHRLIDRDLKLSCLSSFFINDEVLCQITESFDYVHIDCKFCWSYKRFLDV
jgi:hypothetical protein